MDDWSLVNRGWNVGKCGFLPLALVDEGIGYMSFVLLNTCTRRKENKWSAWGLFSALSLMGATNVSMRQALSLRLFA